MGGDGSVTRRVRAGRALALVAASALAGVAALAAGGEGGVAPLSFTMKRIDGSEEKLSDYAGKVVMIVNTASKCGYTPQYEGLEALQRRYGPRGFVVLGFPSNDFKGQEPGSDAEIAQFCRATYAVEFPMFSKIRVTGPEMAPLYRTLTSLPAPLGGPVEWNFQKYLLDRSGRVVAKFPPRTEPDDPGLVAKLEALL